MKIFLILSCSLFFSTFAFAQQTLKGSLQDTANKKNLGNSVISILTKADSLLVDFTRSDSNGEFIIQSVPAGEYQLLITHPLFGDYVDRISVKQMKILLSEMFTSPKKAN